MTLATNLHVSPFEIFAQECDEVIMLINFYLMLSEHPQTAETMKPKTAVKEQRIRVNEKTATGGWF